MQNIFKNINAQRVIYSLTAPVFEKFKNVYMLPACSVNYAISVIIVLLNTALQIANRKHQIFAGSGSLQINNIDEDYFLQSTYFIL